MPARSRSSLYFIAVVVVAASVMTLTAVPALAGEPALLSERFAAPPLRVTSLETLP